MKVIKTITETREVDIIEDVLCNKCGETCKTKACDNLEGLIEVVVCGGYGSHFIGDMNQFEFSVCEKCLMEFVATFKIQPVMTDLLGFEEEE